MERDYDKEIEAVRLTLSKLIAEKEEAVLKNLPDLKGRYFRAAYRTFYKVLEVVDVADDDEYYCDVFCVDISREESQAAIKSYVGYCGVSLSDEITEEEFMRWYNKALEIIKL